MKTDLYTKVILTVIALAMSAIALQQGIPSAFAQSGGIQKVIICDARYPIICAGVSGEGALKIESK
jgi:hypothetical protein